jgi:hypothetical protein
MLALNLQVRISEGTNYMFIRLETDDDIDKKSQNVEIIDRLFCTYNRTYYEYEHLVLKKTIA